MADYSGYGIPRLDFSALGNLPEDMRRAQLFQQQQQSLAARQKTLAEIAAGGEAFDYGAGAKRLLGAGDFEGGLTLLKLADEKFKRDLEERKVKVLEAAGTRKEAPVLHEIFDPATGLPQKALIDPVTGAIQPIGGTKKEVEKPRQMGYGDISKMTEEGGKLTEVAGFANTFQDRFAGYKNPTVGSAVMTAGRLLPQDLVGKDVAEGAAWWQDYNKYRGVVRNELYGAALSKGERQDFEAADITPGMTPEQIKKNLAKQEEIVKRGVTRKAGALVNEGFNPETIARAYGVKLEDLGVQPKTTPPRGGASAPRTTGTGSAAGRPAPNEGAVKYLEQNPHTRDQFDAMYGAGMSDVVLGQR